MLGANRISVDPATAAGDCYDLAIVGGGIYGACMALEAAQRGLRTLLLERDDFGGATSANSLRILDGGLQCLRQMDLTRCLECARECAWFMTSFPDLVRPLACVMPLDGKGCRRASIHRHLMAFHRCLTPPVKDGCELPESRVMGRSELVRLCRTRTPPEYKSAALWYDALISSPQRLMIELLRWAADCGAVCLNYMQAEELVQRSARVTGVLARDRRTNGLVEFRCGAVVNCAGPWAREVARVWDRDYAALFHPCLAFNVWLDVEPPCPEQCLVIPSQGRHGRTLFLVPQHRGILVGTQRVAWSGDVGWPTVSEDHLFGFLADLDAAIPDLRVSLNQVLRVYAGFVPARSSGSPRPLTRPVFCDHAEMGGPVGLYSVSGVAFTTARLVAERSLERIFGRVSVLRHRARQRPERTNVPEADDLLRCLPPGHDLQVALKSLVEAESVFHLDDLMLRRTDWAEHPEILDQLIAAVWGACQWDETRRISERARLAMAMRQSGSPWPTFTTDRNVPGMTAARSLKL